MEPKYQFYEIVRVAPQHPNLQHLAGLEGAILGMSSDEQGDWYYAVHLYDPGQLQYLSERELEPTGRSDKRETFYDGTSITVTVDPETGEGKVVSDNEPHQGN